ncbi:hypothetical protein BDZ91DRAFT_735414 [Kalaharituber pfeilii]|nr:hypothetical protein BDZ91DRAFT_735414 [Kalaharituber pfeilii]
MGRLAFATRQMGLCMKSSIPHSLDKILEYYVPNAHSNKTVSIPPQRRFPLRLQPRRHPHSMHHPLPSPPRQFSFPPTWRHSQLPAPAFPRCPQIPNPSSIAPSATSIPNQSTCIPSSPIAFHISFQVFLPSLFLELCRKHNLVCALHGRWGRAGRDAVLRPPWNENRWAIGMQQGLQAWWAGPTAGIQRDIKLERCPGCQNFRGQFLETGECMWQRGRG